MRILRSINSHSDDEKDFKKDKYIIKELKYQSQEATIFMHWVDAEIKKVLGENGTRLQQRIQEEPPQGIPSSCNWVSKGLPIYFYDPGWYNNCTQVQKVGLADTRNVAFLLDVSSSIKGNQDPNEMFDSQKFSKKYLYLKIQKYKLPEDMVQEVESEDSENKINSSREDID
ncbi:hypothetical protein O181_000539 [Austropuccinia psidii MF-1]|uniref:Uncharacterized protein n=1 Tax=Austropuccinia psidii MF-1 TaxID=1389203 RepID=A0A9Q3GB09_9BASI|nr:hypothetical protein [Austropuccinia psidii MF-1]